MRSPRALPLLLLAAPALPATQTGEGAGEGSAGGAGSEKAEPEWIWTSAEPREGERIWTCRPLAVEGPLEHAILWGGCDDACEVFLDGERVAASSDWRRPFRVDVTDRLRPGRHVLAASCENGDGPAGLWLELVLHRPDGGESAVVTDATWSVSARETEGWKEAEGSREGWGRAVSFGILGVGPWGPPTAFEDGSGNALDVDGEGGDDGVVLPAEELELPDGFRAELLYAVPKDEQGSWVSLAFDDRGRLIASDQYGSLYRLVLPPPGAANGALEVEELPVELGRAHGLLHAFGALWVVVAEDEGTGLYRLRDTDGDDGYDDVRLVKAFDGSGEHGPHAVVAGPDGRSLYVVGGNHTRLPEGIGRFRPTRAWGEDQLLPRLPDPNGHAVGVLAPGGWVVRTDPDGETWELVAIGFRNAYDLAFDAAGELFTFDSDMEWDVGLPWYRPTRICHVVSGADFGWRHGSGKWPAHVPDSLPGVVDVGLSSPTGVVFGTETAFHAPYREALFAADWAYGTIYAVHLEPAGASFTGRCEPFASGRPFAVTDLAVGPDGALYVSTGGRRSQSALYRIASTRAPAPRPEPAPAEGLRAARRVIERNHGLGLPSPYWSELGSADRFVAHAARTLVEQGPLEGWAAAALEESDPRIALQALVALIRVAPEEYGERVFARAASFPFEDWEPEQQLGWTRLLELCLARAGRPGSSAAADVAARLADLTPSGTGDLDRRLVPLLVALEAPRAAEKGVALLDGAASQEDAIHYACALRTLESGWTLPLRRRYFRWLDGEAPRLAGGHSLTKYVAAIRADAVERLPDELRAWQDLLAPPVEPGEAHAAEALEAPPARFVRAWTLEDLAPALDGVKRGRDYARGRSAFRRAACFECHRLGGEGGSTGPDLTGAGSRFGARDLLESILQPSRAISDQYQETEVLTADEVLTVGRVVEEDAERLVVRTLPPREELVTIDKSEVALRRPHPLSRMPSGLVDTLTRDEILDMLAYCIAGGRADDPAFVE